MSGRDQASPVSLSPDMSLRRLGEMVRELLRDNTFLSRLRPGPTIRTSGQALQWSQLNRVDFGVSSGIVELPQITPAFVGVPLYLSKQSASGLALIKPTGGAQLDGSATGIMVTAAGLTVAINDGANWSSDSGGTTVTTQVAAAATGSVGEIALHDLTHAPVALFQFQENIVDTSGRGTVLNEDAGQARYSLMTQRLKGLQFSGLRLKSNPGATWLRLQGDMTVEMMGMFEGVASGIFCNYTGGNSDAAESLNYQWQVQCLSPRDPSWFSEHGVGVNDRYTPTMMAFPPPGQVFHLASTRISDRVQFYLNGAAYGTLSPTLVTPTGGESAHLFVGGEGGTGAFSTLSNFVMASLKVIPTGLSAAAVKAEYARTLGPYMGTGF